VLKSYLNHVKSPIFVASRCFDPHEIEKSRAGLQILRRNLFPARAAAALGRAARLGGDGFTGEFMGIYRGFGLDGI
jgi:hypothetical protein